MPAIPVLSRFPELNVRTYVNYGNKPGVYFFSLDAGSHLAVRGARAFYHLPYFYAEMKADDVGNEIEYRSSRRGAHAEFRGRYGPSTPRKLRSPGTLEHWLTERYCLYTVHHGNLYRGEVHHARWPLQDASAEIQTNTMANAAGIRLPDTKPLLHFSKRQDVLVWPLEKVSLWVCSAGILPAVAGETPARQPPGPFGKLRAGWRRYIGWGVRRSNRGSFGMEWAARIILRFFSRKFLFLRSCE